MRRLGIMAVAASVGELVAYYGGGFLAAIIAVLVLGAVVWMLYGDDW